MCMKFTIVKFVLIVRFCLFQRLVSVGLDGHATINVWDWRKGKIMSTVRGHSDRVSSILYFHFYLYSIISLSDTYIIQNGVCI